MWFSGWSMSPKTWQYLRGLLVFVAPPSTTSKVTSCHWGLKEMIQIGVKNKASEIIIWRGLVGVSCKFKTMPQSAIAKGTKIKCLFIYIWLVVFSTHNPHFIIFIVSFRNIYINIQISTISLKLVSCMFLIFMGFVLPLFLLCSGEASNILHDAV